MDSIDKRDKIYVLRDLQQKHPEYQIILQSILDNIDVKNIYPCQIKLLSTKRMRFDDCLVDCILTKNTYVSRFSCLDCFEEEYLDGLILNQICSQCEYFNYVE